MAGHKKAQRPGSGAKAGGNGNPAGPNATLDPANGSSGSDEERQQQENVSKNMEVLASQNSSNTKKCAAFNALSQVLGAGSDTLRIRLAMTAGLIPAIVSMLAEVHSAEVHSGAAALLSSISALANAPDLIAKMLECDVLPGLVNVLQVQASDGVSSRDGHRHALTALATILGMLDTSNQFAGEQQEQYFQRTLAFQAVACKLVYLNAIPRLVQLLKKPLTHPKPGWEVCMLAAEVLAAITSDGLDEHHGANATDEGGCIALLALLPLSRSWAPQTTSVVRCLANLALSEANQVMLGQDNLLGILFDMLDPMFSETNPHGLQREVLRAVYVLTTNADNQSRAGRNDMIQKISKFLWSDTGADADTKRYAAGALRNISAHPSVDVRKVVVQAQPALIHALKMSLAESDWMVGDQVAGALRNLMLPGMADDNRTKAVQAGVVDLMLQYLIKTNEGLQTALISNTPVIYQGQAQALGALRNLLISEAVRAVVASKHAAAGTQFVALLSSTSLVVQEQAAGALKNLLMMGEAACLDPAASERVVAPLVKLLGSRSAGVQGEVAGALRTLSLLPEHKRLIPACGAIAPLIGLLKSSSILAQEHAAGALWALAVSHPGNTEAMVAAKAVTSLSDLLQDSRCQEVVREQAEGARQALTDGRGLGAVN